MLTRVLRCVVSKRSFCIIKQSASHFIISCSRACIHSSKIALMHTIPAEKMRGVWSATPTPFDDQGRVDAASVERLVEHHLRLGVKGLFLAGTCGEGAWMPNSERRRLVQSVVAANKGRMVVSVQVTDNSAARILDNM